MAETKTAEQRFPQLTTCLHCRLPLRRNRADEPWTRHGIAGTTSTECDKAPNPDDGPMPSHEPGTAVLMPPEEPSQRIDPAVLPKPYMPTIPRFRG